MSEDCIELFRSIGISCANKNIVGGVNKRVWVTQLPQIASSTTDVNGNINTITMGVDSSSASYTLKTITSYKNSHSGTYEGAIGDNVNLIKHNAILKIYTSTQAQKESVEAMFNAEELVVFFETENGQIEVYGFDKGLEASALGGGTGVGLQDDTAVTLTLSGDQRKLPNYFLAGGTLATSIAYLDNISEAV